MFDNTKIFENSVAPASRIASCLAPRSRFCSILVRVILCRGQRFLILAYFPYIFLGFPVHQVQVLALLPVPALGSSLGPIEAHFAGAETLESIPSKCWGGPAWSFPASLPSVEPKAPPSAQGLPLLVPRKKGHLLNLYFYKILCFAIPKFRKIPLPRPAELYLA